MNGKGSTPRPVDGAKYRRNYERIFRSKTTLRIPIFEKRGKTLFCTLDDKIPPEIVARAMWLAG